MTEEAKEILVGGDKYIKTKKLGSGSYGEIFLGSNAQTRDQVAIKIEDRKKCKHPQLAYEYRVMKSIKSIGIPEVYNFLEERDEFTMIMELLGPNLEDLLHFCGHKFSLKTVLMIAYQMLNLLEHIHSKNFIHRDIKPENFLIGLGKRSMTLYLIDFGLAKKYKDQKTHQHIPYKENKNLTGTARYASINAHLGIEQSRRDDLEAIGYVFIYLLRGELPWQGVRANNKAEKYHKIMEKKMATPIEYLCKGLPTEFATFLHYCRSLRFDDRPDYVILKKMFCELMLTESIEYDCLYDWANTDPAQHLKEEVKSPEVVSAEVKKETTPVDESPMANESGSEASGQINLLVADIKENMLKKDELPDNPEEKELVNPNKEDVLPNRSSSGEQQEEKKSINSPSSEDIKEEEEEKKDYLNSDEERELEHQPGRIEMGSEAEEKKEEKKGPMSLKDLLKLQAKSHSRVKGTSKKTKRDRKKKAHSKHRKDQEKEEKQCVVF